MFAGEIFIISLLFLRLKKGWKFDEKKMIIY